MTIARSAAEVVNEHVALVRQANWQWIFGESPDRDKGVASTLAPSRGRTIARWDVKRR